MPRKKPATAVSTLTSIIDVSDDDFANSDLSAMMPTPDSMEEKKPVATKRRAAGTSTARSKIAAAKTTASSRKAAAPSSTAPKKRGRTALKDLTNVAEEEEEDVEVEPERKKAKPSEAVAKRKPAKSTSRNVRPGSAVPQTDVGIIQETQAEPSIEVDEVEIAPPIVHHLPRATSRARSMSRQRSGSRQPESLLARHHRAGSGSVERGMNDPALRRRLGEMTNKYESLEIKYSNLKDIASAEAQSSFDKLKSATEMRAKNQDKIIESLRKELAAMKEQSGDARSLRTQLVSIQIENDTLKAENKNLKGVQNEIKTLQAKLAATRAQSESAVQTSKSSAAASNGASNGSRLDESKSWKMKEDLYTDLTGLMIHSVKRVDGVDVFDCIQTGRNGTLRFNLSIEDPTMTRTPGAQQSYDDIEMTYTPMLDEKNDKHLVEILEDFLIEDICFPRNHAQGFYTKVRECMTRKVEIEE